MERNKWFNIKILKDDTFNTKGLKKGDYFLFGNRMVEQINNKKKIGDKISYYKVLNIKDKEGVWTASIAAFGPQEAEKTLKTKVKHPIRIVTKGKEGILDSISEEVRTMILEKSVKPKKKEKDVETKKKIKE